jgi:hypothetical protein
MFRDYEARGSAFKAAVAVVASRSAASGQDVEPGDQGEAPA